MIDDLRFPICGRIIFGNRTRSVRSTLLPPQRHLRSAIVALTLRVRLLFDELPTSAEFTKSWLQNHVGMNPSCSMILFS